MKPKVLITGINGKIAQVIVAAFSDAWDIYGIDLQGNGGRIHGADISDWGQVSAVFAGIGKPDIVIHLAAVVSSRASWDDSLRYNVIGTRHIYECAKNAGAGKVIFASSVHVVGGYDREYLGSGKVVSVRDPIRPDGDYGTSKAFGEALARQYYENFGLHSICIRIGSVTKKNDPRGDERLMAIWLSHRDLVSLIGRCVAAEVGFGIYFGCSDNATRIWDISDAERDLGYIPQDDSSTLS